MLPLPPGLTLLWFPGSFLFNSSVSEPIQRPRSSKFFWTEVLAHSKFLLTSQSARLVISSLTIENFLFRWDSVILIDSCLVYWTHRYQPCFLFVWSISSWSSTLYIGMPKSVGNKGVKHTRERLRKKGVQARAGRETREHSTQTIHKP